MNWLLNLLSLLGSFLGLVNRKQELNNIPDMKQAARAQNATQLQSHAEKSVAKKNETTGRKHIVSTAIAHRVLWSISPRIDLMSHKDESTLSSARGARKRIG
jgi:hypothetical protein